MKGLIQKNFTSILIAAVGVLILLGAMLSYYNRMAMKSALTTGRQSEAIMRETENLYQNIRSMDISIRGYALMNQENFLFLSKESARATNQRNFRVLDSLLALQGYQDPAAYASLKKVLTSYTDMYAQMITLVQQGKLDDFKKLLAEDRGKTFWVDYDRFAKKLLAFENDLNQQAQAQYETAMLRNSVIQWLLVIIGLPAIILLIRKLRHENAQRQALLLDLEANNQKYLFNSGQPAGAAVTENILETSIENLKTAAEFVTQISEGNYTVEWPALTPQNQVLNEQNLVGRLIGMREQMKRVKMEDEKRLWATEGLTQFSEIIRNHQHKLSDLSDHALAFLVKYLRAQQGSLFIHRSDEITEAHLELSACYAFDRKKFLQKRVSIGQGLVGQTYLEAQTLQLTEIPQGYTHITSGLGESTPSYLVVVPMKYNDQVEAILEMAAYRKFAEHEIIFLEKAGEFVASAIANAQTSEKTSRLLEQFQIQTEQMRAQEEELRQNMEELEATQEEMRRKEQELEERLAKLAEK